MSKTNEPETFYVTTPIYYVNDVPHVGTLYTTLAADVLARHYRAKLGAQNVLFLTGTDEHGQKIAESASKAGLTPKEFADSIVPHFKSAWDLCNISYDVFMRTTDQGHIDMVTRIFQKLYDDGHIYKGAYEGMYCVGCEKFVTDSDMVDGRCPDHPNKDLVYQKEENYFFALKKFAPLLLEKINDGEYEILPEKRRNEIYKRVEEGLEDISISRESVAWGIPVPWDTKHTFYVWVEALFNYYTATQIQEGREKFWPADLHLVGKDIVWFHACIWEALLIASDLPLPKKIFGHGFFTLNGQKMSKSLGNVISPAELVEAYGVDGARYLILTAFQFGNDGDLALSKFDEKYNADLAHGLGNLVARTAKLAEGMIFDELSTNDNSSSDSSKGLELSKKVDHAIEQLQFDKALTYIWENISAADKILNETEPWKIKDDMPARQKALEPVVELIRQIALNLQSCMPETAHKILLQFEVGKPIVVQPSYFYRTIRSAELTS